MAHKMEYYMHAGQCSYYYILLVPAAFDSFVEHIYVAIENLSTLKISPI